MIYAIHSGILTPSKKPKDIRPVTKRQNNPHAHLIVPFRRLDTHGFKKTKLESRTPDRKKELGLLRESWADIQNRAFERSGLKVRVSAKSLKEQGISRTPSIHMGAAATAKEVKKEPTLLGDKYLQIQAQNQTRKSERQQINRLLSARKQARAAQEKGTPQLTHYQSFELLTNREQELSTPDSEHLHNDDYSRDILPGN